MGIVLLSVLGVEMKKPVRLDRLFCVEIEEYYRRFE
jgi:hypothetical protein